MLRLFQPVLIQSGATSRCFSISSNRAHRLVRFQPQNASESPRWAVLCDSASLGADTRDSDTVQVKSLPVETVFPDQQTADKTAHEAAAHGIQTSQLRAPLPLFPPPAVICIGLNYRKHAQETKNVIPENPIQLMKNPHSVTHPFHPIRIPRVAQTPQEVDYETELAFVLGQDAKDVQSPQDAIRAVLGYTVGNDVSARRWQGKRGGGQWSRAKSFDTFCPLGPALLLASPQVNPNDLAIRTHLNGKVMQDSNTSDMIFGVAELICYLSQGTTLAKGTVILTGTPSGVGYTRDPPVFLQHGDSVSVSVERIGHLTNPVIYE